VGAASYNDNRASRAAHVMQARHRAQRVRARVSHSSSIASWAARHGVLRDFSWDGVPTVRFRSSPGACLDSHSEVLFASSLLQSGHHILISANVSGRLARGGAFNCVWMRAHASATLKDTLHTQGKESL